MNSKARRQLRQEITGMVLWDKDILRYYSVDASAYQVLPDLVVVPAGEGDVVKTVRFAKNSGRNVTVRGAGTSLVGGPLNNGIILDMKNLDSIKIGRRVATVGPGASKGRLDEMLRRHGKFFAPNPSIGRYCSIGGMLGNNASGSKSLKYGSTIDNVLKVTFVDGRGDMVTLPSDTVIGGKILALASEMDGGRFPMVAKNSAGYRIDKVDSIKKTHSVIIGSEGTLGVIVSAKLRIRDIPKRRALYVVEYGRPADAAADCHSITKTGPAAVEFVDAQTLKNFNVAHNSSTRCLLFIEYDSNLAVADRQIRKMLAGNTVHKISAERSIRQWWRIRDMSLHYSIKSIRHKDRIPHVIEDAVVPVKRLAELFDAIKSVNSRFGTEAITYGHAGDGNIHVRLLGGKRPANIKEIARYYFKQVVKLGGSVSGEHGDGIARTPFVRFQYGQANYRLFKRLKEILDPHCILNPGKIVQQAAKSAA